MRRLLPLVLLLAACTGETAASTTALVESATSTSTTSTTTPESTTTTEATTTIEAEGPIKICPRGLVWEPGTTYSAECFVVPVVFDPSGRGWGSLGGGDDWLKVRWRDPGDDGFPVRVAIISYSSSLAPAKVLDRIAARELISEVSTRTDVVVGGASGLVVDVEGDPELGGEVVAPGSGGCTGDTPVWFGGTSFGHPLLGGAEQDVVGVGACDVVRIWVVQAGDLTVTIVGGTTDPARHAEAVAKIEELFEGMSFEVAQS